MPRKWEWYIITIYCIILLRQNERRKGYDRMMLADCLNICKVEITCIWEGEFNAK